MKLSVRFHNHTESSLHHIMSFFGMPGVMIELGCFEGDTTFNLARIFKERKHKCDYYAIDPFLGTENLTQEVVSKAKELFVENLKEYPEINFIEKTSFDGLLDLHNQKVKADLIYVDGSHFAKSVLADAVLGFELLHINGIMLFDDAVTWRYGVNVQDSPKIAIDNFIQCNWDRLELFCLPNGYQTAVRRIK